MLVTYTGKVIDPRNPKPEDISIFDIAHALSKICRFAGNTPTFYSVAIHSMRVSMMVEKEHRLAALLHDATEAYLGDVPKPIKDLLPEYKELEDRYYAVIAARFNLPKDLPPEVKMADYEMLQYENWEMLYHPSIPRPADPEKRPMYPSKHKQLVVEDFLGKFVEYGGEL